jgi:hypothetical protein
MILVHGLNGGIKLNKTNVDSMAIKHSKQELIRPGDREFLHIHDNLIYHELGTNLGYVDSDEMYHYYIEWNECHKDGIRHILNDDIFRMMKIVFEFGIKTEKARISRILELE